MQKMQDRKPTCDECVPAERAVLDAGDSHGYCCCCWLSWLSWGGLGPKGVVSRHTSPSLSVTGLPSLVVPCYGGGGIVLVVEQWERARHTRYSCLLLPVRVYAPARASTSRPSITLCSTLVEKVARLCVAAAGVVVVGDDVVQVIKGRGGCEWVGWDSISMWKSEREERGIK